MRNLFFICCLLVAANCFAQKNKHIILHDGSVIGIGNFIDSIQVEDPVTGQVLWRTIAGESLITLNGMDISYEDRDIHPSRIKHIDSLLDPIFTDTAYTDEVDRMLVDTTGRIVYYRYYVRYAKTKSLRKQRKHIRTFKPQVDALLKPMRFPSLIVDGKKRPFFI